MAGKTGRRTKLTPERQDTIVEAVQAGYTLESIAVSIGISRSTLFLWLRKNSELANAVKTAEKHRNEVSLRLCGLRVAKERYDYSGGKEGILGQMQVEIENFRMRGRIPLDLLVEGLEEALDHYWDELDEYTASVNGSARWFGRNWGLWNG